MMKKLNAMFSVIVIMTILGCEPAINLYYLPPSFGTLSAKINGASWEKTYKYGYQTVFCNTYIPFSCQDRDMDIVSDLHDKELIGRQTLLFASLPRKTGIFKLVPYSSVPRSCNSSDDVICQLYTRHGDQYNETFNTIHSDNSYVRIEKYNHETGEIKGSFEILMAIEGKGYRRTLPDTLHFTHGQFHTKILVNR